MTFVEEVAMAKRKVRDEPEAERLLLELDETGQELVAFCRARGIDGRSLGCWRRNLERRGRSFGGVRLLELTPRESSPAWYRVVVGDVAVEVEDDFRDDTLRRLLAVVRSC